MSAPLLIELLTEELPPKALHKLSVAFADGVRDGLVKHGLMAANCAVQPYATPRRLAVLIEQVRAQAGQVRSCARLRVSLAPDVIPGDYAWQIGSLLVLVPMHDQGGR